MDIKRTIKRTWIVSSEMTMATGTCVVTSVMRTGEYVIKMGKDMFKIYSGMIDNIKVKLEEV